MPFLFVLLFLLLLSMAYAATQGAPWVPTWRRDIERLRALLDLKKGQTFYELGCGDGRVCTMLAKDGGIRAVGIELSFPQWLAAQVRARLSGSKNVRIEYGNVFSRAYNDADALYFFLMPEAYEKLAKKLRAELRPGTKVVTYVWPLPGWEPVKVDRCPHASDLYLYVA